MEDDWRTPPEGTLPLIRIHDVRGQQTNWEKAKELSRKWPRSYRKTQDLLTAAKRYAQKKGWFSTERSRLLRVQSEIYALNKALQTETAPIMLATATPAAFMIEFLSAFSDAFPNWQVEYSVLNRLIPLCMRD